MAIYIIFRFCLENSGQFFLLDSRSKNKSQQWMGGSVLSFGPDKEIVVCPVFSITSLAYSLSAICNCKCYLKTILNKV